MTTGASRRPLYARALRLRRVRPGPVLCFIFLWGAIALGVVLALGKLASWWAVLALPVAVAVMVKLNDIVAGATARTPPKPQPKPKPDRPPQEKPAEPLTEDEQDEEEDEEPEEEDEEEDEEEEDTEKTESPTATRSSSD